MAVKGTLKILLSSMQLIIVCLRSSSGTDMGIFEISFPIALSNLTASPHTSTVATLTDATATETVATTTPITTTTTPKPIPDEELEDVTKSLQPQLENAFSSTTGYVSLVPLTVVEDSWPSLNLSYSVVYNKTTLNDKGLLKPGSEFIDELSAVSDNVSSWENNFGSYTINPKATKEEMHQVVQTVNSSFESTVWLCASIACQLNETCLQNSTTSVISCRDKCQMFVQQSSCTSSPAVWGVYLEGDCAYTDNHEPYCDCGTSPGDVMNNFYDGTQCVSVTFIVAMAASAGAFLLILLLLALGAFCYQKKATDKAKKEGKRYKAANKAEQHASSGSAGISNNGYNSRNEYCASYMVTPADGLYSNVDRQSMEMQSSTVAYPTPDYDDTDEYVSVRM